MACFFSIPFSNNPYITPWGTIGQEGKLVDQNQSIGSIERKQNSFDGCRGESYPYHMQPGETLYSISGRLGVKMADLLLANPGLDPGMPGIGQTICIPACPPDHFPVYIQPGDTLEGIARQYGTSVESILESNPGIDPNYLRIGQRLCIFRYTLRPYTGI